MDFRIIVNIDGFRLNMIWLQIFLNNETTTTVVEQSQRYRLENDLPNLYDQMIFPFFHYDFVDPNIETILQYFFFPGKKEHNKTQPKRSRKKTKIDNTVKIFPKKQKEPASGLFFKNLVGTIGLEPTTPTMSR